MIAVFTRVSGEPGPAQPLVFRILVFIGVGGAIVSVGIIGLQQIGRKPEARAALTQILGELRSVAQTVDAIRSLPLQHAVLTPLPAIAFSVHDDLLSREVCNEDYEAIRATYEEANQLNASLIRDAAQGKTENVDAAYAEPVAALSRHLEATQQRIRTIRAALRP